MVCHGDTPFRFKYIFPKGYINKYKRRKNMPKYSNEQIERAKNVDVRSFLEQVEGFTFQQNGKYLKCANPGRTGQPSSLSIDTKLNRIFYNAQTGNRPLSAIDWCTQVKQMDFQSALKLVLNEEPQGERTATRNQRYRPQNRQPQNNRPPQNNTQPRFQQHIPQNEPEEKRELYLSEAANTTRNAFDYLTKEREIPANIVNDCIKNHLIYEDTKKNVVFVGYDDFKPQYATRRGTYNVEGKEPFKRDCAGSDTSYAFRLEGKNTDTIYVAEGATDVLSLAALEDKYHGTDAYKEKTYLSTGGAGIDKAIEQFCKTHDVKTINICFDNDEAGRNGMNKIMEKYRELGYTVNDMRASLAHDYNDELKLSNKNPNFYAKPPITVEAPTKEEPIIPEQHIPEPPPAHTAPEQDMSFYPEMPDEYIADRPIVARYQANEENIVIMQYPNGQFYNHYGYDDEADTSRAVAGGFATLDEAENTLLSHRSAAVKLEHIIEQSFPEAPPVNNVQEQSIPNVTSSPEVPQNDEVSNSEQYIPEPPPVVNNQKQAEEIIPEVPKREEMIAPVSPPPTVSPVPDVQKQPETVAPEVSDEAPVVKQPVPEITEQMSKEQKTILLFASMIDRQESKRADLLDKIDRIDRKIADRTDRIDKLNAKVEDLELSIKTSKAFEKAFSSTPLAKLFENSIAKKEAKIEEIRKVKIPKHEGKIQVQEGKKKVATEKLGKVNRKIDKLEKVQSFFTAISSKDREERHQGFVTGLENLSDFRRESLENKLHKINNKIEKLTADYSSPNLTNVQRHDLKKEIAFQEVKARNITKKISEIDNLHKDLSDIKNDKFTETEIEAAIDKTADKISERLENADITEKGIVNNIVAQTVEAGSEAISEVVAEKGAVQAEINNAEIDLERVPDEREPDVTDNKEQQIMNAIAAVTGIDISELNRLPVDIKTDIIAEYQQNNGNITTEQLTERICNIADITPQNVPVQQERPLQTKENNPLRDIEDLMEQNDNQIDGVINNLPPEKPKAKDEPLFSRSKLMGDEFKPTSEKANNEKERSKNHNMSI